MKLRAARAMEEAARRFPGHDAADDLEKNARKVRAGLADHWR